MIFSQLRDKHLNALIRDIANFMDEHVEHYVRVKTDRSYSEVEAHCFGQEGLRYEKYSTVCNVHALV